MTNAYPNLWRILLGKSDNYRSKAVVTYGKEQLHHTELIDVTKRITIYLNHIKANPVIAVNLSNPLNSVSAIWATLVSKRTFWICNPILLDKVDKTILKDVFILDDKRFQEAIQNYSDIEFSFQDEIDALHPFCWTTSSGSTSEPKITEHTYRSIMEDTFRQIRLNKITTNDKIDLLSTLNFSASLASIFPAIFSGASLHIKKHTEMLTDIFDFWTEEGITMTTIVPSLFRPLFSQAFDFKSLALRFVCLGGEKTTIEDINLFNAKMNNDVVLQVALASSEARTIAEFRTTPNQPTPSTETIPYGFIENKRLLIVDESGKELPFGHRGKIAISSEIIGTRYLNATNNFLEMPNGERLFISDDEGIFTTENKLILVDTHSRRPKFKGEFIDLDSIEKEILKNSVVKECHARLNQQESELFLFIASKESKKNLRIWISNHLSLTGFELVVFENGLPKTESGKLQAKELHRLMNEENEWTETNIQEKYEAVWRSTFKHETNFKGKNFFNDLAGDSIKALKFTTELSQKFNRKIEPNCIYLYPVYDDLKIHLENIKDYNLVAVGKTNTALPNVLIFPWINGGFDRFKPLIELLKERFNFYVIKYPLKKNENFQSPLEIATYCAEYLNSEQITFKYFIGFSVSGLLGYQTLCLLSQKPMLILIDTPTYEHKPIHRFLMENSQPSAKIGFGTIILLTKLKGKATLFLQQTRYRNDREKCKKLAKAHKVQAYFEDYFSHMILEKQPKSTSEFPIGIFIASQQKIYKHVFEATFDWEKFNSYIEFREILEGDHESIFTPNNLSIIAEKLL